MYWKKFNSISKSLVFDSSFLKFKTPQFLIAHGWKYDKKAKGAKVKILLQGLYITHVIFVLVHNFKFCISSTPFNIAF
jgi:hypothetical protein